MCRFNRFEALVLLFFPFLFSCSDPGQQATDTAVPVAEAADLVLTNAAVYTVDAKRNIADAVAITGNRIVYVGDTAGVEYYIDAGTDVRDLGGRMVMPGLHDMHIHPAGLVQPDACSLEVEPHSLEELVPVLKACIERYGIADGNWLIVDQWAFSYGNQPSDSLPNLRAALDAVSETHPIMMMGDDGHHAAVNSLALALAKNQRGKVMGITPGTIASEFFEYRNMIGVDDTGNPNGGLSEQARFLVMDDLMRYAQGLFDPPEQLMPAMAAKLAAAGVTSIQEARADSLLADYYAWLADSGKMTFRLRTALYENVPGVHNPRALDLIPEHLALFRKIREELGSFDLVQANAVKLFADGVLEGNPRTLPPTLPVAAVLGEFRQPVFDVEAGSGKLDIRGYVDTGSELCEQVRDSPGNFDSAAALTSFMEQHGFHPQQCSRSSGILEHSESYIMEYVRQMTEAGFHVHIHAISDKAVRVALDAFEAVHHMAREAGLTQSLTHVQLAHPDDVQRMGELGIYVTFTYAWAIPDMEYDLLVHPFIDELEGIDDLYDPDHYYMQNVYPVRSVRDAGGILAWGSDAPVGFRDPMPFPSIQAAVTRRAQGRVLNAGQTISIHDAIAAHTVNGARLMGHDNRLGSIEVGKTADLIVLDQNIVQLAEQGKAAEIGKTHVDMTVFDGRIIYTR